MKKMFIGGRGTNEKYRSLSNFLENFRQIALFVLSCKKIKFLRDFFSFGSYISYTENTIFEEHAQTARVGFAVVKRNRVVAVCL